MAMVPAAAFVVVFGIIFGSYWLSVLYPERREARALHDRLKATGEVFAEPAFLKAPEPLSVIKPLDWVLARATALVSPVRRLISESGLALTTGAFVLATIFFGVAAAALAAFYTSRESLIVAAGLAAASIPMVYVTHARAARMEKFESQFPDAMDLLARSLRAGHALSTAFELAGNEIADPVGSEFRLVYERQNFGMSIEDALRRFAARVPLLDARFFVTSVLTQREVGGNLAEVLDKLAAVMRERFTVKRQIRVISAHGRITGLVLGLLPIVVAAALFVVQPDHLKVLFQDPIGVQLLITAAVLQVVGVLVMKRIINVEY